MNKTQHMIKWVHFSGTPYRVYNIGYNLTVSYIGEDAMHVVNVSMRNPTSSSCDHVAIKPSARVNMVKHTTYEQSMQCTSLTVMRQGEVNSIISVLFSETVHSLAAAILVFTDHRGNLNRGSNRKSEIQSRNDISALPLPGLSYVA